MSTPAIDGPISVELTSQPRRGHPRRQAHRRTPPDGVATFSGLTLNQAGNGYQIEAVQRRRHLDPRHHQRHRLDDAQPHAVTDAQPHTVADAQPDADRPRPRPHRPPTPSPTPHESSGTPAPANSRKGITAVSVGFSQPLDPASADNLGLYHVLEGVKKKKKTVYTKPLKIRSVSYVSSANAVTIDLAKPYKGACRGGRRRGDRGPRRRVEQHRFLDDHQVGERVEIRRRAEAPSRSPCPRPLRVGRIGLRIAESENASPGFVALPLSALRNRFSRSPSADLVFLDLAIERPLADAEQPGGFLAVAARSASGSRRCSASRSPRATCRPGIDAGGPVAPAAGRGRPGGPRSGRRRRARRRRRSRPCSRWCSSARGRCPARSRPSGPCARPGVIAVIVLPCEAVNSLRK